MVALLEPTGQTVEETTQERGRSSAIEREILDLLGRPARSPLGLKELKRELLSSYTLLDIQRAMLDLLDRGRIQPVYTAAGEMGFKLADQGR